LVPPRRLSTNTGIRAVDLGMPQLSMHSIREMMGCDDLAHATALFEAFFRDFRAVESALRVDEDIKTAAWKHQA
jgi:aspartyl aminopeptidase